MLAVRPRGSTSSTADLNSRVGTSTASTPKPVVTTNIQARRRAIRSVDTCRQVLTTYNIAMVIAKYQPAQTKNPRTRPMPPPGTVPGATARTRKTPASIQTRNSSQMAKPRGTRNGRCL